MLFKQPMFALVRSKKVIAVIQATNKKQALSRAELIGHLVKIPEKCKVRPVLKGTIIRAPMFFEGHFRSIEDALSEA